MGGIPATAAIARTALNIRTSARSPVAALVHSLTALLAVVTLAPLMADVPMASLTALLFMVAWNISDAGHVLQLIRIAPRSHVAVLLACFSLTVLFDMVLAVSVGMFLAAVLFVHRMAKMTGTQLLAHSEREHLQDLPEQVWPSMTSTAHSSLVPPRGNECAAPRATLFIDDEEHQLNIKTRNDVLWDFQSNLKAAKELFDACLERVPTEEVQQHLRLRGME